MTPPAKRHTDHVRSYARMKYIEAARRRGEKTVRIVSGDIYRALKVPNVASAATAGVDLFVTNDPALRKLRIPGIRFMAGLDGKIF